LLSLGQDFSDLIPKRLTTRGCSCTSNHGKTTSNQKNPKVKNKIKIKIGGRKESNMEIKIYFPSQRNDQTKPYSIIN